jgi:DNA-binding transcriptional LysR family regulator
MERAERMERQAEEIWQAVGEESQKIVGKVRVTSVPIVINRLLVPSLPHLSAAHPALIVELVPDARNLSLTRREADLAIRLARPASGGTCVKARRIGTLAYAVFAAKRAESSNINALPWITYDETMAHLPQAKWLAGMERSGAGKLSGLRVTDAETAIEAAACGIGKALLPSIVGASDARLQAVALAGMSPPPKREVWLLSHADQRDFKSIRAAREWIETIRWSDDG